MNNPTPRDSAQLPQCLGTNCTAPADHHSSECQAQHDATIGAQAASVVAVGWRHKDGHTQWRDSEWAPGIAEKYTAERGWTPLYASAPPAHVPADVEALPQGWEALLWAAMEESFRLGKHRDLGMVIDDTQVGVEFTIAQIKKLLKAQHSTPEPAQAVDAVDKLTALVTAVDAEMADSWGCNSYHPTLRPALEAARRAALQASRQPQAQQGGGERGSWTHADTARLDALQVGLTVELLVGGTPDKLRFRVGGIHNAVAYDLRTAIDIATKEQRS